MPLAPEYSWKEDACNISLEVPLKGISAKNVDLYGNEGPEMKLEICHAN